MVAIHIVERHVDTLANRRPRVALVWRRRRAEADHAGAPAELGLNNGPIWSRKRDLFLEEERTAEPFHRGGCVRVAQERIDGWFLHGASVATRSGPVLDETYLP